MGQASASASTSLGQNIPGGSININRPNYVAWVVIGAAIVLGAIIFLKKKR